MKDDVEKFVQKQYNAFKKNESQKVKQDIAGYADRINPDFAKAPAVAKNEENVLGLLLLYPEHRKKVFEQNLITVEDFYTDLNRRVYKFIQDAYDSGNSNFENMDEAFSPEEIGRITKMKINRMQLAENGPSVLLECINSLRGSMQKKTAEKIASIDDLNKLIASMRK